MSHKADQKWYPHNHPVINIALLKFRKKKFFYADVFLVNQESSNNDFDITQKYGTLGLKNSSETGHLWQNYGWSNLLFRFTKIFYSKFSLNIFWNSDNVENTNYRKLS